MTPFLQLVLALIVIIAAAKAGGWVAVRLRQPAVLGELLVGVILGPSLLDMLDWPVLVNPAEPHLLTETVLPARRAGRHLPDVPGRP
jgi:Kef-type K+ transport system membrane component KefB